MTAPFDTFLSAVTGAAASVGGATDYLGSQVARSTLIRIGLGQGLSPTSILGTMRSNGLGMRTQNFYRLVDQLRDSGAETTALNLATGTSTIDPSLVNLLDGGTAGKYMVNVRRYYTSTDEDGDVENGFINIQVLQDELDIDDAIAHASQIVAQSQYPGSPMSGTTLSYEIGSVNQWQG